MLQFNLSVWCLLVCLLMMIESYVQERVSGSRRDEDGLAGYRRSKSPAKRQSVFGGTSAIGTAQCAFVDPRQRISPFFCVKGPTGNIKYGNSPRIFSFR